MDDTQFDTLTRALFTSGSRRRAMAAAVGGLGTALGVVNATDAKKKKKKKKKKKNKDKIDELPPLPPPQCPSDLVTPGPCGCCPAPQECCPSGNVGLPLCYDPATEVCCPPVSGDCANVCPPGTRCEVFDDPFDVLIPSTFCCPSGTTTCGFGCCPDGSVCCPSEEDPGYAWSCCPDSSCDEVQTDCIPNGDYLVRPRFCG